MWIVIFLILFGFRVSSLEPSMPSYESQQGDEALSHRDGHYFTTTVRGRLREDMPEFSFDVEARFNEENSCYQIRSVTVRQEEKTLQVISVPELSLFGETAVRSDQEDQLIYGMERGGAIRYYFKTYQYLEGEPVKIREEHSVFLTETDPEVVRRCLRGAAGDKKIEDGEEVEICRETVWERNPDTGEMELTRDEFVFLLAEETERKIVMQVPAGSKMGELLSEEER